MYFYKSNDRESKGIVSGIRVRTFWSDHLMLAVVDMDAHAELPIHSHPHEQGGIVIEGEFEMTIDGEMRKMLPGDVYLIPGGVEHSARVGPAPVQLLDIFTPAREDMKY